MAAALARRELRARGVEGVEVLSAGTAAAAGSPASRGRSKPPSGTVWTCRSTGAPP
jgi:protein-tyrosine-phosphatase